MAEFIKSLEKIIWDPDGAALVLLDFDERMLEVSTLPQTHQIQAAPFLRADFQRNYDRGNVRFESSFSRVSTHASMAAMMNYRMSHSLVIAALRHKTVEIQIKGGDTNRFSDAAIQTSEPIYGPKLGAGARIAFKYRLTLGRQVKVTV